ncbi:hypothetical protein BEH94_10540 [Candidatus Altiarchaeales archaeon WOR_SM1_SCG]|nr:hypothetical protein BEH94_10540 [Candidatus Altiarchaeales archaeon WOR_SM1_SCG]
MNNKNNKNIIKGSIGFAAMVISLVLVLNFMLTPVGQFEPTDCILTTWVKGHIYDTEGNIMNGSNRVRITAYIDNKYSGSVLNGVSSGYYVLGITENIPEGIIPLTLNVTNITTNETIYSAVLMIECGGTVEPFDFPRPNFTLTSANITFNPESPTEGGTVEIKAKISSGNINGTVDILFYDGDTFINYTSLYLPQDSSGTTAINWIPKYAGTHTITVVPGLWDNAASEQIDVESIYEPAKTLIYDAFGGDNKVVYVKIPKDDNVVFAEINLTGSAYFVDKPIIIAGPNPLWKSTTDNYCYFSDTYCFGKAQNGNIMRTKLIFSSLYEINITKLNTHTLHSDWGPDMYYNLTICEANSTIAETAGCTGESILLVNNSKHNRSVGPISCPSWYPDCNYDQQVMDNSYIIYPNTNYLMTWAPIGVTEYNIISRVIDNITGSMFFPETVTINISNNPLWNRTGILNTKETINNSNLTEKLNSQLPSCSCPGCIDLDKNCAIPLIIHSDTRGIIDISINIQSIPKGARIAVSPKSSTVNVNDTFIININIAGTDIYAAEFELKFNPGILEVIDLGEGDFIKHDGSDTFNITNINNTGGKINYAVTRLNDTDGVEGGITGAGELIWIKFRAKENGTSSLNIESYNISNSNISEIENVTASGGTVTVTAITKVNPPVNLTINLLSGGSILLKWNASNTTSVDSYKIYFSDTKDGFNFTIPNATTTDANWTDNTAASAQQRYYVVRAAAGSNEDNNTYVVGKFDIELYKKPGSTGVNWVSIPLNTSITTAQEMANSIGDTFETATRLNAPTQTTEGLVKLPPPLTGFSGSNFNIFMGEAYSISVSANTTWTLTGTVPENISTITLTKKPGSTGVNWIGLPLITSITTAQEMANSIGDTFETATRLNAPTQTTEGLVKLPPPLTGFSGSNFNILISEGYSISVSENTTWIPA